MLSRHAKQRRGATIVETGVVLLIAMTLVLGIFEYGRFVMVRQLLDNAAREAARQAASGTSLWTTAQIQQFAITYLAGQPLLNSSGKSLAATDIQVYRVDATTGQANKTDSYWADAAFGEGIAVEINSQFKPMLPAFGFLPASITMQAKSVMLSEAN